MAFRAVAARESAGRRPARDLIRAVLENMRRNLEPLHYTVLAPSRYLVYLHPSEYARLEGIVPILREQTLRALSEEIASLNRVSALRRHAGRLVGRPAAPVEAAGGAWHVDFLPDPDGDLAEGDILVHSELLLPAGPELGGERTRRLTTIQTRDRAVETRPEPVATPGASSGALPAAEPTAAAEEPRVFARITYEDDGGRHSYDVVKDSVTIGRGGTTYPVDIKIVSSADVSREHARIQRDPQTGRFFLIDLSTLGTTLNGRHVPRGYDEVDGNKRENGQQTPLPPQGTIGLAETVYLDFGVVSR